MTDLPSWRRRLRAGVFALLAAGAAGLAFVAPPSAAAVDPDDLLPVDEAFALSARATADGIALDWDIADGYYLYRHRTSVQTDPGFSAQPLRLPAGEAHEDEFFGRVETYRDALHALLPGQARAPRTTLTVKYQGCADLGICYPPQTRRITVALPAAASAAARRSLLGPAAPGGANPLLGGRATPGTDPLPLPPEQAFGFEAIAGDAGTLLLRFTPARGYYLYRDRTALSLGADARAGGFALGAPQWPPGTAHRDEHFGDVVVYFDQVEVPVPLRRSDARPARIALTARFQGCQTDGICYPPMTRTVEVAMPAGAGAKGGEPVPSPALPLKGREQDTAAARSVEPSETGATREAGAAKPSPSRGRLGGDGFPLDDADTASSRPAPANGSQGATGVTTTPSAPMNAGAQAEDSRLAAALSGPNRWWALLSFFGFGLLLSFTPCVLPMIPILSGLIAGHGPGLGARRAFTLSLVYVLANALVFTAAGVVAGLVGANLQIAFQTPWVIALFALLFVALALSSFGLYELQLPAGLRNRLGALSDRQRGGSWAGAAIMGALSALIVGPCVAPPLAAAVLYIGQSQDPAFGGAALFLLAMGMGAPLVAFGVAAGKGLPTSGPWMVAVQRAFGFVFLGLAVWMAARVLPGPVVLGLWGALLLGAAATLALAVARPVARDGVRVLGWTVALLLGVAGAVQVVGALAGGDDPLRPLAGLRGPAAETRELSFRTIKSVADLEREVAAARAAGRPLMLDFYADWCVACQEMEKYTFPEPAVHAALDGFVLLKADVTANDALDQALMRRLGIVGPPATLFYADGAERRELRLFGFEPAPEFAARIQRARSAGAGG